jgi:hypothetical protein
MADDKTQDKRVPPETVISPDHPLIVLQTSNRFGDSDEGFADGDPMDEATKHGREAVRAWREAVPDDIKPYCQLQMEIRNHDHEIRYEAFRRVFAQLEKAGIPADFQFADPHDQYVFDPVYVEKLLEEFSCIKSMTITEIRCEHYSDHNVPRYAVPPQIRYTIDILEMAARHGKHLILSLQDLKWMHIGTDELNQPLVDAIYKYGDYCIPVSEHIGPRHLQRQTSVFAFWIADAVKHWGVEPQSWWFENGRMIEPGIFGQREPDNTRIMPPDLYRAMILIGAMMGATVYDFEPFWDLFDYDNSRCWRNVIYPTLMEVITRKLIPTREQVMEKMKVAFHLHPCKNINEFHENLRDVDWIGDEGLFVRAAYGLWSRYLEHELVPNKGQHYYVPLLPPKTPPDVLDHFEEVVTPGQCDSVEAYEELLGKHYTPDGDGTACIMSINGYTYVMQTHENLYERQTYAIDLPKPVRGVTAERVDEGVRVRVSWAADSGASEYQVRRVEAEDIPAPRGYSSSIWHAADQPSVDPQLRAVADTYHKHEKAPSIREYSDPIPVIGRTTETSFLDTNADPAKTYTYTVTATTASLERKEGTVNYMDYLVFSQTESVPGEQATVHPDGTVAIRSVLDPVDERPASQVVYPTFDGAEGEHRTIAERIVERIDELKAAYDAWDWKRLTACYSDRYEDPNGHTKEYVGWAWKWWFIRNNDGVMLRQIRCWDFSEYPETGKVCVKMFSLFRAVRYDDQPFGYGWDGTVRLPRHADEEVVYTWAKEPDGLWRIVRTEPALPNMAEILWYSRGCDKTELKLRPGVDDDAPYTEPGAR